MRRNKYLVVSVSSDGSVDLVCVELGGHFLDLLGEFPRGRDDEGVDVVGLLDLHLPQGLEDGHQESEGLAGASLRLEECDEGGGEYLDSHVVVLEEERDGLLLDCARGVEVEGVPDAGEDARVKGRLEVVPAGHAQYNNIIMRLSLLLLALLVATSAEIHNCEDPVDEACADDCLLGSGPDDNKVCYPLVTDGADCPQLSEDACQANATLDEPICLWGQAPKTTSNADEGEEEDAKQEQANAEEEEDENNIDMIDQEEMDKLFKDEFENFNQDFQTDTDAFAAKPTCYMKVDQDPCETEYGTEIECKQSETLKCIYKGGCKSIQDFAGLKCASKVSQLGCKYIEEEPCTYKESESQCALYDKNTMKSCDEALNKVACENTHESVQCMWKEEDDQSQSQCVSYRPEVCEGDDGRKPLKYICDQIDLKCKWHKEDHECLTLEDSEGCVDEAGVYVRNKFACVEMNQYCKWIDTEKDELKKCQTYDFENLDKDCEDGRNKFSCRKSAHKCAFGERCELFNNYTHNCDDDLSYTACRLVPFPCGWKEEKCSWFDDSYHKCVDASNEVACLISDQRCVWNADESDELQSTCEEDQSIQAVDSFWASWDENDFNEDFIKKFFEEQERLEKEQNKSNEQDLSGQGPEEDLDEDRGVLLWLGVAVLGLWH